MKAKPGIIACHLNKGDGDTVKTLQQKGHVFYPIVPNISQYARDVTNGGPVKALLLRFARLSPSSMVRLMVGYVSPLKLAALAKKDFSLALSLLTEIELLHATEVVSFDVFCISEDLVDLALAFEQRAVFERLKHISVRYQKKMILFTNNKDRLIQFLTCKLSVAHASSLVYSVTA